jgi:hypothetical protein
VKLVADYYPVGPCGVWRVLVALGGVGIVYFYFMTATLNGWMALAAAARLTTSDLGMVPEGKNLPATGGFLEGPKVGQMGYWFARGVGILALRWHWRDDRNKQTYLDTEKHVAASRS